jgi:hypothetical protein
MMGGMPIALPDDGRGEEGLEGPEGWEESPVDCVREGEGGRTADAGEGIVMVIVMVIAGKPFPRAFFFPFEGFGDAVGAGELVAVLRRLGTGGGVEILSSNPNVWAAEVMEEASASAASTRAGEMAKAVWSAAWTEELRVKMGMMTENESNGKCEDGDWKSYRARE